MGGGSKGTDPVLAAILTAILVLKDFDKFGAMGGQPVLHVDGRQRSRKLTQTGGGRPYEACQLTKTPMGQRNQPVRIWQLQREVLGIVATGFHADSCRRRRYRQTYRHAYRVGPGTLGEGGAGYLGIAGFCQAPRKLWRSFG